MNHGNAKKISRMLRAMLPNGVNQSAVVACALAYAAPLPVNARGDVTCEAVKYYNTNIYPFVADVVSCVNEVHILEVSMILDKAKETFAARVDAIANPIIAPMSVTANFTDVELKAVGAIVEVLRTEFTGA